MALRAFARRATGSAVRAKARPDKRSLFGLSMIVRGVLLPATMQLLGERNWYLPAWLQWPPAARPANA